MTSAPYCAGPPVGKGSAFVGREDIVARVLRELANHQGILLLQGQRRIGKTSILDHLVTRLRDEGYCTVKIDLQELRQVNSEEIMAELVKSLAHTLGVATSAAADPRASSFTDSLEAILSVSTKRVVILMDEFDRADAYEPPTVEKGTIFWMRALERHFATKISLVLAYGRHIEQLSLDLKGLLKNGGQRIRVSLLRREEMERLVRLSETGEQTSLRWSEAAIDAIWLLTSGHPLLTQAICLEVWLKLVLARETTQPVSIVHPSHVSSAAETVIIERAALQLDWLWEGLTLPCQVIALVLAQQPLLHQDWMSEKTLFSILSEHDLEDRFDDLGFALDSMVRWDLLEFDPIIGYRFRVALMRRFFRGRPLFNHLLAQYRRTPSAKDLLHASIYGLYRIDTCIGSGAMSRVYSGHHTHTGVRVAVKLIDPVLSRNPAVKQRLLDEARVMMALKSSHIVRALDVGALHSGQLYIVMEYLEGTNLETVLTSEGPLPWNRVAEIGMQICTGLATAHRHSIFHRDIKPQNIFRTPVDNNPDHIKIVDFGVARETRIEVHSTENSSQPGTPEYMAPELLMRRDTRANERTDIYSVGVTLYKLLTGKLPFTETAHEGIQKERAHPSLVAPSLAAPDRNIPAIADRLIQRALAQKPADRFATADELAEALGALVAGDAVGETAPTSIKARRPISIGLILAQASLMLAIGILFTLSTLLLFPNCKMVTQLVVVPPIENEFDYESAKKLIKEQHHTLRAECLHGQKNKPLAQLKFRADVRADGWARISVYTSDAETRACVRDLFTFPFEPSSRGGAFEYTLSPVGDEFKPIDTTTPQ